MNLVLHGDNHVLSRLRLTQIIKGARAKGVKDLIRLQGEKLTETDLRQALESTSLFGTNKLVAIENLLTRQKSKEKDRLVTLLAKSHLLPAQYQIILWEPKEISKTTLSKLKGFKAEVYKISPIIFKFLDSVKPGNTKTAVTLIQHSIKENPPELVFYMFCRRISQLIIAKDPQAGILLKTAPWQKSWLISQAQNFTLDQLLSLHQALVTLDESIKTGTTLLPLSSHLDLILAEI